MADEVATMSDQVAAIDLNGEAGVAEMVSESLKTLRDELETLIGPYRYSEDRPPFTTEELITITLVLGPVEGMEPGLIAETIIDIFKYYSGLARTERLTAWKLQSLHRNDRKLSVSTVPEDFIIAMESYSLPVYYSHDARNGNDARYTIRANEARIFLRRHLELPQTGVFPFLELPGELRTAVYEYTLTFPEGGMGFERIYHSHEGGPLEMHLLQRQNGDYIQGQEMTWKAWKVNHTSHKLGGSILAPSMQETLAILSVCKQIYKEAVSVFYVQNKFATPVLPTLTLWASKANHKRLRFLTNLEICLYDSWRQPPDSLSSLKGITSLKTLSFSRVSNDDWMGEVVNGGWGPERPRTYESMPGMVELAALAAKAENVVVNYGAGAVEFEQFLAREVFNIMDREKAEVERQAEAKAKKNKKNRERKARARKNKAARAAAS